MAVSLRPLRCNMLEMKDVERDFRGRMDRFISFVSYSTAANKCEITLAAGKTCLSRCFYDFMAPEPEIDLHKLKCTCDAFSSDGRRQISDLWHREVAFLSFNQPRDCIRRFA